MTTARDITLVMVDGTRDVGRCVQTAWTLSVCRARFPRASAAVMFSQVIPPAGALGDGIAWHWIPYLDHPHGTWAFLTGILPLAVRTSHMLYMQPDGYITHPELWDESWLDYDLVAPPWPARMVRFGGAAHRVGCGGFCLKSTRFLAALNDLVRRGLGPGDDPLDVWECQRERPRLEREYAIRYAPPDVAIRFGVEWRHGEFADWSDAQSFGFHGCIRGYNRRYIDLADVRDPVPRPAGKDLSALPGPIPLSGSDSRVSREPEPVRGGPEGRTILRAGSRGGSPVLEVA